LDANQSATGSAHVKPSTAQIARELVQRFGYRGFYLGTISDDDIEASI